VPFPASSAVPRAQHPLKRYQTHDPHGEPPLRPTKTPTPAFHPPSQPPGAPSVRAFADGWERHSHPDRLPLTTGCPIRTRFCGRVGTRIPEPTVRAGPTSVPANKPAQNYSRKNKRTTQTPPPAPKTFAPRETPPAAAWPPVPSKLPAPETSQSSRRTALSPAATQRWKTSPAESKRPVPTSPHASSSPPPSAAYAPPSPPPEPGSPAPSRPQSPSLPQRPEEPKAHSPHPPPASASSPHDEHHTPTPAQTEPCPCSPVYCPVPAKSVNLPTQTQSRSPASNSHDALEAAVKTQRGKHEESSLVGKWFGSSTGRLPRLGS